jgi:signal transduction histidine kinase
VSDGLLVAAIAVLGVADLMTAGSLSFSRSNGSGLWTLGTVALVAAALVAVAIRRAHLVVSMLLVAGACIGLTAVAFATGVPLTPSFAALAALALLGARAVRIEPVASAAVLVAVGAVAVAAESVRTLSTAWFVLFVLCEVCFAAAVAAGAYLRWVDWRRVVAADSARQDERLEIARELHDLVGHYVTGIVVQAQAARHVASQHPDVALESLEQIEIAGGHAMAAMRRMVGGLRDDAPTAPEATWDDLCVVVDTAAREGLPVQLTMDPSVRAVSPDLAMSAHRIVAESLTNVRRHAVDVTDVRVEVSVDAPRCSLVVLIADDGTTSSGPGHDTYGLVGMHERAESLGGRLEAGPGPSGGWLVRADLPLGDR